MRQYLDLVQQVLREGERRTDRTGVGTLSIFGAQMRFDLREGFPLVTTKKVNFDAVVWELLWMLSGSTNVHDLHKACRACQGEGRVFSSSGLVACPKCSGTKIDPGSRIWDNWAREHGYLGPVYGSQWRAWENSYEEWDADKGFYTKTERIDQIQAALETIKTKPDSRRIIVNAWNVAEIEQMALPPCHAFFQFYVGFGPEMTIQEPAASGAKLKRYEELVPGDTVFLHRVPWLVLSSEQYLDQWELLVADKNGNQHSELFSYPRRIVEYVPAKAIPSYLDCQLYQRSGDVAIGVPFNIASYALLTQMFAHECGLTPRHFIHTFGDAHIYLNHVETIKRQLDRSPRPLPKVKLDEELTVLGAKEEQIHLEGYDPHPFLKFEIAV
jgi:thymidylate synthase